MVEGPLQKQQGVIHVRGRRFRECGCAARCPLPTIFIEACRHRASTLRSVFRSQAAKPQRRRIDPWLEAQFKRAEAFRRMHGRGRILLLPNAWDAMSARIFEAAGFEAIATTSAGVAYASAIPTVNWCRATK